MFMSNSVQFSNKMKFVSASNNVTVSSSPVEMPTAQVADNDAAEKEAIKLQQEYQRGWDECQQKLNAQIAALENEKKDLLSTLISSLNNYFEELEKQIKQEISDLSFEISKVILMRDINDKDIVGNIIEDMLGPVMNSSNVKIHLNSTVVQYLQDNNLFRLPSGAEFVVDNSLLFGEAFIDSSQGIIDATLSGRLDTLQESLNNALLDQQESND